MMYVFIELCFGLLKVVSNKLRKEKDKSCSNIANDMLTNTNHSLRFSQLRPLSGTGRFCRSFAKLGVLMYSAQLVIKVHQTGQRCGSFHYH